MICSVYDVHSKTMYKECNRLRNYRNLSRGVISLVRTL